MAVIEKTRKVTETYMATVCDGCGNENVTTNVNENAYCDACASKTDTAAVETDQTDSTPTV